MRTTSTAACSSRLASRASRQTSAPAHSRWATSIPRRPSSCSPTGWEAPQKLPPVAAEIAKRCGYLLRPGDQRCDGPPPDALERSSPGIAEARARVRQGARPAWAIPIATCCDPPEARRARAERAAVGATVRRASSVPLGPRRCPRAAVTRFWAARGCRSVAEARVMLTDRSGVSHKAHRPESARA